MRRKKQQQKKQQQKPKKDKVFRCRFCGARLEQFAFTEVMLDSFCVCEECYSDKDKVSALPEKTRHFLLDCPRYYPIATHKPIGRKHEKTH